MIYLSVKPNKYETKEDNFMYYNIFLNLSKLLSALQIVTADLKMPVALLSKCKRRCEFSNSMFLAVVNFRTGRAQALCSPCCPRGHDP